MLPEFQQSWESSFDGIEFVVATAYKMLPSKKIIMCEKTYWGVIIFPSGLNELN